MTHEQTRYRFWMVWREGSPTTKFRHYTRANAEIEAERLARQCPGETFYVLKSVAALASEPQPVKKLKLIKDEIPF